MRVDSFDFHLPDERIARYPTPERTASRLLYLPAEGEPQHQQFVELLQWLQPNDLLVFNNTEVIPARLFGHKETGGKVEVMVERLLGEQEVLAYVRASKSPKVGSIIHLQHNVTMQVLGRVEGLFRLHANVSILPMLEEQGQLPLPPYMERLAEEADTSRYQTVYAAHPGAVAAPTAGLHFDEKFLAAVQEKGVQTAFVTLHVGAGTFQPVRVEEVNEHVMHSEVYYIPPELPALVAAAKAKGGRVVAVGTTSLRALEAAMQEGELRTGHQETDIFIYPGYSFQLVEALVTNFHLPKSTLLMLVCAFAGQQRVLNAYHEAVAQAYRFFSYGDAMLIEHAPLSESESNHE
ncbi:MAG TPA: tRNA preQ1(34) S-adenosylmethionine ribosyltransferase-isomerase QueA [Alcanivoracaceae bacterium]|nr:tRNA preQ1(34) S-adenosylmethionine ribosyltransferase-isomerase QueA [Alcanivoracaceae bacterium]